MTRTLPAIALGLVFSLGAHASYAQNTASGATAIGQQSSRGSRPLLTRNQRVRNLADISRDPASRLPFGRPAKRQRVDLSGLQHDVAEHRSLVGGVAADCSEYKRQVWSQHPNHPTGRRNPYGVVVGAPGAEAYGFRGPTYGRRYGDYSKGNPRSPLGETIEAARARNPEYKGTPARDRFLLSKLANPMLRDLRIQQRSLVSEVGRSRGEVGRDPSFTKNDHAALRSNLAWTAGTLHEAYVTVNGVPQSLKSRFREWAASYVKSQKNQ